MIEYLVVSLIFFFLGRITATTEDIGKIKEKLRKLKKHSVGIVQRPTVEKLKKKTNPKAYEGEKEMEKLLDKIL